jgi:hypothetical protein
MDRRKGLVALGIVVDLLVPRGLDAVVERRVVALVARLERD